MQVQIKALEKYGLSLNQLFLGLGLLILGILTYYVAPQAFLNRKFEIFFGIMNLLLILMILGMTYISILVLPLLQRWIVHVFLFFFRRDRKLKQVVIKNLQSHQRRNTKTAIMFAISLSFLIFAGSTFALIARLVQRLLISSMGADLYAITADFRPFGSVLEDAKIDRFLEEQKAHQDVEAWTYVSFNLDLLFQKLTGNTERTTFLTDFTGYKPISTAVFSVQDNYLEATDLDYLITTEVQPQVLPDLPRLSKGKVDVVKALFSTVYNPGSPKGPTDPKGINVWNATRMAANASSNHSMYNTSYTEGVKALVPEGVRDALSLSVDRGARLCVGGSNSTRRRVKVFCERDYQINIRAMLSKIPGMYFTGFRSASLTSKIVVSETQYK